MSLEARARKLGFKQIKLETLSKFASAQQLYSNSAYREVGRKILSGEEMIFFEKSLYSLDVRVSEHIALRELVLQDAEALFQLVNRNKAQLQAFLPKIVEVIASLEATQEHIKFCQEQARDQTVFDAHVFYQDQLCGVLRLNNYEPENRKISLAYFLDAAYQGKGIVTQAARGMLEYAFFVLMCNRVELRCAVTNQASRKVAERLGFIREGELREAELLEGAYANDYVFSLLSPEYKC